MTLSDFLRSILFVVAATGLSACGGSVNTSNVRTNTVPVANAVTVEAREDGSIDATLPASDEDGDALTFIIVIQPANGSVVIDGDMATYTPVANFSGADSFSFKVNDGTSDSDVVTVTLNVEAVADAPIASAVAASINEDTAVELTLNASDADGDALTYVIVTQPSSGALSAVTENKVTYIPSANFNGSDSFTYKANDGTSDSETVSVTLNVAAVNDAPVAQAVSANANEDTAVGVTLNASDVDGDALTYVMVTQPSSGTLSEVAGNKVTYTPAANYNGSDNFTYKANDGSSVSETVSVTLNVVAVNDAPIATGVTISTNENTAVELVQYLNASVSDVDGDEVIYVIVTQPSFGDLVWERNLGFGPDDTFYTETYTPVFNFNGSDSFTYRAYDGKIYSEVVTATLNVVAVNDAPVAQAASVNINEDTAVEVILKATDEDEDALTYVIVTQPTSGVLSAVNGNKVAYSSSNFSGTDSFTFKANDSDLDSNISRITLTVTNPADLNTGLVAHYAFEENGNDSSNNQFDATETNVSYISGVKGKAAHLANGNGLLTAFHDWPEMQNFTVSMFVKLDEYASDVAQWPARNVFLSFDHFKGASLENALELALESEYSDVLDRRYLSAHIVDERELYSKVTTDGFLKQWTALTYVREGEQFKVYVNGQLFQNYDAPSTTAFTPANLVMGKNYRLLNQGLALFGAMDELRIYSRAVSLSEVKALSKIEVVTATGKLNDTGITQCSNANGQGQSCPVIDYPNQDAQYGRDLHNNDDSDGHAGFSFTKLDANGNELLANAAAWSCVKDNVTGLIWEVKQGGNGVTGDEGLHDADDGFSWYSSTLGGFEESGYWDWGDEHGYGMGFVIRGVICHGYDLSNSASYCNTEAFVERVNQAGLCGAKDWRLPTREALRSIVSYGHTSAIDKTYFPQTKSNWSSSINSGETRDDHWYPEIAWAAGGTNNHTGTGYHSYGVRLVRGGQ